MADPLLVSGHAMTIVSAFVPRRFALLEPEERLFQVNAFSLLARYHWQEGKRRDALVCYTARWNVAFK